MWSRVYLWVQCSSLGGGKKVFLRVRLFVFVRLWEEAFLGRPAALVTAGGAVMDRCDGTENSGVATNDGTTA